MCETGNMDGSLSEKGLRFPVSIFQEIDMPFRYIVQSEPLPLSNPQIIKQQPTTMLCANPQTTEEQPTIAGCSSHRLEEQPTIVGFFSVPCGFEQRKGDSVPPNATSISTQASFNSCPQVNKETTSRTLISHNSASTNGAQQRNILRGILEGEICLQGSVEAETTRSEKAVRLPEKENEKNSSLSSRQISGTAYPKNQDSRNAVPSTPTAKTLNIPVQDSKHVVLPSLQKHKLQVSAAKTSAIADTPEADYRGTKHGIPLAAVQEDRAHYTACGEAKRRKSQETVRSQVEAEPRESPSPNMHLYVMRGAIKKRSDTASTNSYFNGNENGYSESAHVQDEIIFIPGDEETEILTTAVTKETESYASEQKDLGLMSASVDPRTSVPRLTTTDVGPRTFVHWEHGTGFETKQSSIRQKEVGMNQKEKQEDVGLLEIIRFPGAEFQDKNERSPTEVRPVVLYMNAHAFERESESETPNCAPFVSELGSTTPTCVSLPVFEPGSETAKCAPLARESQSRSHFSHPTSVLQENIISSSQCAGQLQKPTSLTSSCSHSGQRQVLQLSQNDERPFTQGAICSKRSSHLPQQDQSSQPTNQRLIAAFGENCGSVVFAKSHSQPQKDSYLSNTRIKPSREILPGSSSKQNQQHYINSSKHCMRDQKHESRFDHQDSPQNRQQVTANSWLKQKASSPPKQREAGHIFAGIYPLVHEVTGTLDSSGGLTFEGVQIKREMKDPKTNEQISVASKNLQRRDGLSAQRNGHSVRQEGHIAQDSKLTFEAQENSISVFQLGHNSLKPNTTENTKKRKLPECWDTPDLTWKSPQDRDLGKMCFGQCVQCSVQFSSQAELELHVLKHIQGIHVPAVPASRESGMTVANRLEIGTPAVHGGLENGGTWKASLCLNLKNGVPIMPAGFQNSIRTMPDGLEKDMPTTSRVLKNGVMPGRAVGYRDTMPGMTSNAGNAENEVPTVPGGLTYNTFAVPAPSHVVPSSNLFPGAWGNEIPLFSTGMKRGLPVVADGLKNDTSTISDALTNGAPLTLDDLRNSSPNAESVKKGGKSGTRTISVVVKNGMAAIPNELATEVPTKSSAAMYRIDTKSLDLRLPVPAESFNRRKQSERMNSFLPQRLNKMRAHSTKNHKDGTMSYHCSTCFSKSDKPHLLYLHCMDKHKNEMTMTCSLCRAKFTSVYQLNIHYLYFHPGAAPYRCRLCRVDFHSSSAFEAHIKLHCTSDGGSSQLLRTPWKVRKANLDSLMSRVEENKGGLLSPGKSPLAETAGESNSQKSLGLKPLEAEKGVLPHIQQPTAETDGVSLSGEGPDERHPSIHKVLGPKSVTAVHGPIETDFGPMAFAYMDAHETLKPYEGDAETAALPFAEETDSVEDIYKSQCEIERKELTDIQPQIYEPKAFEKPPKLLKKDALIHFKSYPEEETGGVHAAGKSLILEKATLVLTKPYRQENADGSNVLEKARNQTAPGKPATVKTAELAHSLAFYRKKTYHCSTCQNEFLSPHEYLAHLKSHIEQMARFMLPTSVNSHRCAKPSSAFTPTDGFPARMTSHVPRSAEFSPTNCMEMMSRVEKLPYEDEIVRNVFPALDMSDAMSEEIAKHAQLKFMRLNMLYEKQQEDITAAYVQALRMSRDKNQHNCQQLGEFSVPATRETDVTPTHIKNERSPHSADRCKRKHTHGGEKSQLGDYDNNMVYKCAWCKAQFERKADIQIHSVAHFPGAFRCSVCSCCFRCKRQLSRHMSEDHSSLYKPVHTFSGLGIK